MNIQDIQRNIGLKWIEEAKERIESNKETIDDIEQMCGSDWSRNKHIRDCAVSENKFLQTGINLIESIL